MVLSFLNTILWSTFAGKCMRQKFLILQVDSREEDAFFFPNAHLDFNMLQMLRVSLKKKKKASLISSTFDKKKKSPPKKQWCIL